MLQRVPFAVRCLSVACALALFAGHASAHETEAVRTIAAKNGRVLVERQSHASVHADDGSVREQGAIDLVTVEDAAGNVVSESTCSAETGSYDDYRVFFGALTRALEANDAERLAALVEFPLRVNRSGKKPLKIANAAALRKQYAKVFGGPTRQAVLDADPAVVFCRDDGAMIGHGVVWARKQDGRTALYVVNPH
ncbi:MAG: hypothetical protein E6Q50_03350 [Lysobacter sp.]|nr:MAG: hypothetical protein E6Q50_03350 [Lysobacter sp.]